ncbi:hypothetical protein [Brevundimonas sp.]|uniref:hypothetical protein n=1 Tax=Brevundimonas sp. TaxID=1871086 RepID=UPI0028A2CDDA|nr:hypothetical protein [Brevundimonas sp.]
MAMIERSRSAQPAASEAGAAAGEGPQPVCGEIRVIDGNRCRFIERELEGDTWEVIGPADSDPAASPERCNGCGHVGPVPKDKISCCPDGRRYDLATEGGPMDTVWRCAMTVACNIAIDEQNRTNDDDGPSEVLNAQGEIIRRLKGVLDIDRNYRSEVEAILSHGSEPFITAPSSEAALSLSALQPVALPTDEGGCVTKRFVIFTTPGWAPEKKGGWLKDEHLIDFLRSVMLHDNWKPGFRATVLELTWDNDLWASSATEYLSMHDEAIGPRRARKAWQEARAEHERIYKAAPKMKLGDEIDSYRKATAMPHPAPDALREAAEALEPFAAFGRFEAAVAAQAPDIIPAPDDSVFKHWVDAFDMKGPKLVYGDLRRAASVLAALQADQGAK